MRAMWIVSQMYLYQSSNSVSRHDGAILLAAILLCSITFPDHAPPSLASFHPSNQRLANLVDITRRSPDIAPLRSQVASVLNEVENQRTRPNELRLNILYISSTRR
ncbi:hypothetical protein PAXRUDRAFT_825981 [Paxillus rubicundulus Ve08.2h10]|uniref:Uncharacterized protein n=1 Tax=Paxillus rubicundulus Ve08.2h10 TaxID=930991 RepID=A0A0D0DSI3_9AGAM|nr:hypothetical protein PAXRUDRAFT_825981 [Paxillus rubicundulus Ve08.2h10]